MLSQPVSVSEMLLSGTLSHQPLDVPALHSRDHCSANSPPDDLFHAGPGVEIPDSFQVPWPGCHPHPALGGCRSSLLLSPGNPGRPRGALGPTVWASLRFCRCYFLFFRRPPRLCFEREELVLSCLGFSQPILDFPLPPPRGLSLVGKRSTKDSQTHPPPLRSPLKFFPTAGKVFHPPLVRLNRDSSAFSSPYIV